MQNKGKVRDVKAHRISETTTGSTKGVLIARENRSACNALTDQDRDDLTIKAMSLIYGGNGPQIAARRR